MSFAGGGEEHGGASIPPIRTTSCLFAFGDHELFVLVPEGRTVRVKVLCGPGPIRPDVGTSAVLLIEKSSNEPHYCGGNAEPECSHKLKRVGN